MPHHPHPAPSPFPAARRIIALLVAIASLPLLAKGPSVDLDQAVESAIQGTYVDIRAIQPPTDSVQFLRALAKRLARETNPERRERIPALMDGLLACKRLCQDRETILGLLEGAAALEDRGSERALGLLVDRFDPKALSTVPQAILVPLQAHPSDRWFDLARRAKAPGTFDALKSMASKEPRLKEDSHWMQAMAANGDLEIETAYIHSFLTTEDARRKMDLAESLRHIGTRKTLAALAQEMRTPLVFRLGRVFQTPVREHITVQLRIAFPEMGVSYPYNTDASYAQVEAFCEKEFGTKWKTKRPPVEHSGPLEHGYQPLPTPMP